MVKFKDFSRPLSVFQVLFQGRFNFKNFSRCPVYSSTFQACANPESVYFYKIICAIRLKLWYVKQSWVIKVLAAVEHSLIQKKMK